MDYHELWETTMNPETRTLKRITIENVEEMMKAFDICMGTDVEARRTFIEDNAYKANLVE